MNKSFIRKVLTERIVDTKTYRYAVREHADRLDIVRIELCKLGTTAALHDWQVVKIIR